MERGSEVFLIIRAIVLLQLIHGTYFCPSDQIYQNVTESCCYPVFNCRPGNGVVFCTINGTSDTCTPCPEGEIQPQLVSSLDGIDATCFRDETQNDCTSDEFMPARKRHPCGIQCICNNDNCYYLDDPCRCKSKTTSSCEIDMTMDKTTGECVKCPKYTFKNKTGCGYCHFNETEWFNDHRKGISTTLTPLTSIGVTVESKYNNSRQVETLGGMVIPIAAVIATVVAFGVLLILACIFRQRLKEKWLLLYRQCQDRPADDDPASLEGLTHTILVDPEFKVEVKESETPVMEVRPVVQYCNGAQNAQSDDNSLCQREETEREQTYVKEVVGGQTHNEEDKRHSMTIDMKDELCSPIYGQPSQESYGFEYLKDQITEPVEAVNDHCISDSSHTLLEESVRQNDEEQENSEKEVAPLIAQ